MAISHPFRLGGDRIQSVNEGSDRLACEIAASVLLTIQGERGLAPLWGIPDPVGEHVDEVELAGWVHVNEPELRVQSIDLLPSKDGSMSARVAATWNGG
jgi:hypothetical protein